MTERELKLRTRIDRVNDEKRRLKKERDVLFNILFPPRPQGLGYCVYCGRPRVRGRACGKHRQLLALDETYGGSQS